MDADTNARYHVVLEGRRVGPYDRRTIVGMRIKQTLSSADVLVASDGHELTVADLLGKRSGPTGFNPSQSGVFSLAQATYSASLLCMSGRGLPIPDFRGEMEVRVHSDVLRLAGRYRQFMGMKETRIKIPLGLIMHAQAQGSRVDLWLRNSTAVVVTQDTPLQRISLDLFSPESARELLASLPSVPAPDATQSQAVNMPASNAIMTWGALIAVLIVIGVVVLTLMFRRRVL
ncbi:hypothetical protein BH11PSE7_BH11PSE7_14620 [soil metagenome]